MNIKVLMSAALAFGFVAGAHAQSPGKIAVIYLQGAIGNTKDGQKAVAELEAKTAPKKKQIDQRQSEIASMQDQLTKGANTMSDAAKNDLYKNIETKKKNLQRDVEDAQAELDQDQQKILQTIGTKMQAVIERYAHDHGYIMVVDVSSPQSPVFYASPSIDITKEIIELYDQSTTQLSNPAPAPKTGAAPSAPPAARPATAAPPAPKPAPPKQ
ncbi:MAG TPA: OmpH family outer membrane protein [Bryobacteraceae bacterium]